MKVKLEAMGDAKGVRIPDWVIRECDLGDTLELRVENGAVVLTPGRGVREGWDAAFERMAASGDDAPLMPDTLDNDFDDKAWSW